MPRPIPPAAAVPFGAARARALQDAADLARQAPSIHDTQPWTIELEAGSMALRADRSRQLPVLDPQGRALIQSVGAALFDVRVALAARGWDAEVTRLPRADDPDLLADVRPVLSRPDGELACLEPLICRCRTNRRRFTSDRVPDATLRHLASVAAQEDVRLIPVLSEDHRRLVASLTEEADRRQSADPAYRSELRGVDAPGTLPRPREAGSTTEQTLVLLATATDDPAAWLRTGEALEHLLLRLTGLGWAASPIPQAVEVPLTRIQLRSALTWTAHPQMLLRIGRADPTPAPPRRDRGDVVLDTAVLTSAEPARPAPVGEASGPVLPTTGSRAAPPRRPVSDGRGGTVWR